MQKQRANLAAIGILAAIYFVAGKLGLTLASVHPSATAVWPPAGIALAAFLLLGYRVWPGIWVGAFLANLTTAGSVLTSIGVATGNTLEGLVGAYLVIKYANGRNAFRRARDTFKFAFLAGIVSTTISATIGVTSLSLGGYASWANYGPIWLTWWLGDGVGDVVVAPLLILWSSSRDVKWSWARFAEVFALMASLSLVALMVFGGFFLPGVSHYPLEYLCIPSLIWAAYRFGPRKTATATLVLSGIAIWGTLHGFGPFVTKTQNESLLILQLFLGILAVTALVLAAAVAEGKREGKRFGLAVESAPNAMVMVDQRGKIVLVNSHAVKLFGYKKEDLVGRSVEVLVPERFRGGHPEHRAGFSARPQARPMGAGRDLYAVRKDGSEFPVEIGINPVETQEGLLVLSAIVDITERKRAEEDLRHLAVTDPLTGLANYRKLIEVLDAEIKRYDRTQRPFAVLLLDLDGLKKINDQYGHLTGSRALCRLADILRVYCRNIDTAARYGGDEFAIVIPEAGAKAAQEVAHRILQRVAEDNKHPRFSVVRAPEGFWMPVPGDSEEPRFTVSIGTAVYPHDGEDIETLLAAADRALYEMKRHVGEKVSSSARGARRRSES